MFDLQPTLTDPLVTLRPLVATDWSALFTAASDPAIWALHPAHDRWQEPVFRAFFADALASGGALVALDPVTGAVIGSSRYEVRDTREVEIGWTFLAPAYWGGTVNAAMKRLMIAHALDTFERVVFMVGAENLRSRRALEKIGAVLTDRVEERQMAGRAISHVIYAIDRAGFSAGPLMVAGGQALA